MLSGQRVGGDALADATIHQQWVSMYRTPEAQGFYEMAFDEIARRLDAPPDAMCLDAGAGSCAKSVLLAARGFRVTATDFSEDALKLAAENVRAHGFAGRIALKRGDLLRLPFDDGEFPYVLCWAVLMHVPELQRAMAELARVLAPGGALVLSEGNMRSAQSKAISFLRLALGKGRGRGVRVPAGVERRDDTEHGTLLTRQTDMQWFVEEWRRHGLTLEARISGQLSELYVLMPWLWLRKLVHTVNRVWFLHVGRPGPAFGNILILRKQS